LEALKIVSMAAAAEAVSGRGDGAKLGDSTLAEVAAVLRPVSERR
jgi:hypothetical protein